MSPDFTARLGLPYLAAGQMQKHVTLNEALTRLDALTQTAAVSRTVAAQPAEPDDGDLYILPAGRTGAAWAGFPVGALVRAETGAWFEVETHEGLLVWVADVGQMVVRQDDGWAPVGGHALQQLTRLGLNTEADATNPLAARLNAALLTALETTAGGDGDLRVKLNKQTPADVLSLLFQSGFSGRAEIGLVGDDRLALKVSADGAAWVEALKIEPDGRALFPKGAGRCETTVLTASGAYAVPVWARRLKIILTGGGGGGGGAAGGPGTTGRYGGGGGGAGGRTDADWPTAGLAASLDIVIGAGGTGGAGAVGTASGGLGDNGGDSTVASSGAVILTAEGGLRGGAGTTTSGAAGAGGHGAIRSNGGGAATLTANGGGGPYVTRPDGPGGGAAGGSLETTSTARGGGLGGQGNYIGGAGGRAASGAAGGVGVAGGAGGAAALDVFTPCGGGGGGGGATTSGAGAPGGEGGAPGGGGGGGGAGPTGGGAGGAGGQGRCVITAFA